MRLVFSPIAWEQYLEGQETDRKLLRRLNSLIEEVTRSPFKGRGKPEPLRNEFSGYWSRRIDGGHRLVYRVEGDDLLIAQCRYHYPGRP